MTVYFEFVWIFCCYLSSLDVSQCKVFKFRTGFADFNCQKTGLGKISCFHVRKFIKNNFFLYVPLCFMSSCG